MSIYVGTSGFSYPEWIGPVYPDGTRQSKMLEVFSSMFDLVEINATFYRPPSKDQFKKYPERTGGEIKIVVKLHDSFTHRRNADSDDSRRFTESVMPLNDSGQFAAFLAQFPQSFHNTVDAREYIEKLRMLFPKAPLVCEFRHKSWWNPDTLRFLKELDISMSSVDAPEISNLPSRGEIYTAEPAYLRLHGRNKDAWFEGGREARYTYRYNKDELSEWLRKMKKLLVKSGDIYIAFNNHPFGYSAMNATEFLEMLREIMPDSVPKRKLSLKSDSDQPTLF